MKYNHPSFKKCAVLVSLFLALTVLPNKSANAQCGFSLGTLDVTKVLTFSASPGTIDTEKITIVNTSTGQIQIYFRVNNFITFSFRVLDSERTIQPGASATVSVRFQPSATATDSGIGSAFIMNQSTRCLDSFTLIGHLRPNLCLETLHSLTYQDPVIIGTTAQHEFHLTNQSGADITITGVALQDSIASGFKITSPLPLIVPKHSTDKTLTYTFSPASDFSGTYFNTTFATINLSGDSVGCKSVTVLLIGNVAKPGGGSGIDTTLRPLFPSDVRTLAIEGTGMPVAMRYTFTNNLNVPVTVNNVYMKDGTYFSVAGTNPSPTPFTLSADQTMDVTVHYNATDNLIHTDSLKIDATHNFQTIAFPLQGEQVTSGVANALPAGVVITVTPNPASHFVTIALSGVRSAEIGIYDLLGKEVTHDKATSLWKWDSSNYTDGSYIIRIEGESMTGNHFVISKCIIIKR